MIILNMIVGPLVEAWGEVKVQKTRVILSLVGVVAAVAALSVVMALGDLMVQSQKEILEAYSGRQVTLHLVPQKVVAGDDTESPEQTTVQDRITQDFIDSVAGGTQNSQDDTDKSGAVSAADTGKINDPVGSAMRQVADRFKIPYWSRKVQGQLEFRELKQVEATGMFRDKPVSTPIWGFQQPTVSAVDPDYNVIFRLRLLAGRWLQPSDSLPRLTPIVINENLWKQFGSPELDNGRPWVLTANDDTQLTYRVVGVVKSSSEWEAPGIYLPYEAWQVIKPSTDQANPEMLVWSGPDQADRARSTLPKALASVLGEGWTVSGDGGQAGGSSGEEQLAGFRMVVSVIGGIVILLGAMGLLNVAIVTVRQRIREIGIRRAMGASALRIFFAVFMESVVATFVAGIMGVGIGAVALRHIPIEYLGIYLQDVPAFPMSAAVMGLGIAVSVGALCGIIPALAAVRIRPIEAIRS